MAQKAEIELRGEVNSFGNVRSGITVKFNVVVNGKVQYKSFYSSSSSDPNNFRNLTELGELVKATGNYTYNVLKASDFHLLIITSKYYGDTYNFGTFYSSDVAEISLVIKTDNENPVSTLSINSVSTNPSVSGGSNGSAIISATTNDKSIEYSIDNFVTFQGNGTFNNLAPGNYTAYARDSIGGADSEPFVIGSYAAPLQATITPKDVTVNGGADGEINVTVTSGTAPYIFLWNDAVSTEDRTDLVAGDYSVTITDNDGQTLILYAEINEPDFTQIADSYLYVPTVSSLRYVRKEDIDWNNFFPNSDNTLFADQKEPGIATAGYCQKVTVSDSITVQLQSNYDNNTLVLKTIAGSEVLRVPFEKKLTLTDIRETYTGEAGLNDISGPAVGTTPTAFIYPDATEFTSGNVVVITDNPTFNGTYAILSRGFNPYFGREYVEINKEITTGSGSLDLTVTFINDVRPYDIYEAIINFGQFIPGHYQSTIEGSDAIYGDEILYSEPIKLLSADSALLPKLVTIDYQNEDNAFDMAYSTGIVNRIRVEGRFFKLVPGGDSQILRQSNGDIVKISANAYRGRLLETYKLPTWVHEKLSAVFQHDHIKVNALDVQTDEEYEVEYTDYSPFVSGQINLEVLGWFDVGNGHDPGTGMTETGLIIANGGYIRR